MNIRPVLMTFALLTAACMEGATSSASETQDASDVSKVTHGITGFMLVNASTDKDIRLLVNNDTIDLAVEGKALNIRALATGRIGAVIFGLGENPHYRREGTAPFALAGNHGNDYFAWTPTPGDYAVTATPDNGGSLLKISFTVVEDGGGGTTGGTTNGGTTGNGGTETKTYLSDDVTDFLNPERGWMRRANETEFANARTSDGRHGGYTVVWPQMNPAGWNGYSGNPFRLDNYRTTDLPASLTDKLNVVFRKAREAGIKLKIRFAYNYDGGGADASKSQMLRHISQLGPVLWANADVLVSMDAGLIGSWGEMHGSRNVPDTQMGEVVWALLRATPKRLHVGVRYPRIIHNMFGERGYAMDLASRFSGSDQSRVGWYNDCLWSNRTNTGTYREHKFDLDRNTFETVGRFAGTSGESCDVGGLNQYNDCGSVLRDMETIQGPDTLNRGWWLPMIDKWKQADRGCYDEISRRLGYRLSLVTATLPNAVKAGQPFSVAMTMQNKGFGKVFNPRAMDLLFKTTNATLVARLGDDVRKELPLAGETVTHTWTATAPQGIEKGRSYQLFLRLPDPSLASDPRYAIRLANWNWNASTSAHDFGKSVKGE